MLDSAGKENAVKSGGFRNRILCRIQCVTGCVIAENAVKSGGFGIFKRQDTHYIIKLFLEYIIEIAYNIGIYK